ncbi:MAG: Asp23/Gls24 family envelope stress response protein [Anaerolineaceae bacterium]|nr:Asp23/Gls24 family envelope stress response protein [Anaerolineaceae bacterium]
MTNQKTELGKIYILPQAIRTVARNTALQSYGVIGLAPANLGEAIRKFFCKDSEYGILVKSDADGFILTLNLIVEYGMRIRSVTDSVAEAVTYHVQKVMGVPVKRVNVHVRGLRISNPD